MSALTALRALLAALALSAVPPGAWATLSPRSFYDDFPGAGHWVSRLPGYSEHLVTDVGAFYLAFALMLAWAALRPARALVVPLCTAWALFSAIHLGWHATHLGAFDSLNAIAQTASLAAVLAGTLAALAIVGRSQNDHGPPVSAGRSSF